jgi:hypothetical protein
MTEMLSRGLNPVHRRDEGTTLLTKGVNGLGLFDTLLAEPSAQFPPIAVTAIIVIRGIELRFGSYQNEL